MLGPGFVTERNGVVGHQMQSYDAPFQCVMRIAATFKFNRPSDGFFVFGVICHVSQKVWFCPVWGQCLNG